MEWNKGLKGVAGRRGRERRMGTKKTARTSATVASIFAKTLGCLHVFFHLLIIRVFMCQRKPHPVNQLPKTAVKRKILVETKETKNRKIKAKTNRAHIFKKLPMTNCSFFLLF